MAHKQIWRWQRGRISGWSTRLLNTRWSRQTTINLNVQKRSCVYLTDKKINLQSPSSPPASSRQTNDIFYTIMIISPALSGITVGDLSAPTWLRAIGVPSVTRQMRSSFFTLPVGVKRCIIRFCKICVSWTNELSSLHLSLFSEDHNVCCFSKQELHWQPRLQASGKKKKKKFPLLTNL